MLHKLTDTVSNTTERIWELLLGFYMDLRNNRFINNMICLAYDFNYSDGYIKAKLSL